MRRFKSEFAHSYTTYSFGYTEYAIRESGDMLEDIYAAGFLPYSGSPDISHTLYMARSARITLNQWEPNSENRRIIKRFDGEFQRSVTPLKEFDRTDDHFIKLCTTYFSQRHGATIMPKERLIAILESGFVTDVVTYHSASEPIAYALEGKEGRMGHFWFSFYDLAYMNKSLGMWLMIDGVRNAKGNGKNYYYIGTVYGEKALYKTNFDALEYWDGNEWSEDVRKLKELSRSDSERIINIEDEWKRDLPHF